MNPNKTYVIEFIRDTSIGALVHYSAPFTGFAELVVPKGARAFLRGRCSIISYYCSMVEDSLPSNWNDYAMDKIRKESRFPKRLGGFSLRITIFTLLSSYVKFLPAGDYGDIVADNPGRCIKALRKQKCGARRCARLEDTEKFQKMVEDGWCHYQLSKKERDALLRRLYKKPAKGQQQSVQIDHIRSLT